MKCRLVDVGPGFADDIKEHSYKAEAVNSSAEDSAGIGRFLKLILS